MNDAVKRYTNLASLIAVLKNKELTLLDPSKWEDKNDAHYLLKYGQKKGFKSLYALCFTKAPETSHHWKVFAPGADGVCIIMNAERFFSYLKSLRKLNNNVKCGDVDYKLIDEVENDRISIDKLPFLKRYAFRDELEYRMILGDKSMKQEEFQNVGFDISIIEKITLSNALRKNLREPLVDLLKSIDGCSNLKIHRSTLNENSRWKKACERAT